MQVVPPGLALAQQVGQSVVGTGVHVYVKARQSHVQAVDIYGMPRHLRCDYGAYARYLCHD